MNSFSMNKYISKESNDFSFEVTRNETKDEVKVSPDDFWRFQDKIPQARGKASYIQPEKFQAFTLDRDNLSSFLSNDLSESIPLGDEVSEVSKEISLPTPDGDFARFEIEEVWLLWGQQK